MNPRSFLIHGLVAGLIASIAAFIVAFTVAEPHVDAAIELEESAAAAETPTETETPAEVEKTPATASTTDETESDAGDGHSHSINTLVQRFVEHGGDDDDGTVVSRANQSTWGLLTGLVAVGVAIGGLIGLASAFALGRLGNLTPAQSTGTIALAGFIAFWLVPFWKYPATPPAVGSGETIGDRTMSYFAMQAISVLAAVVAVMVAARLVARVGGFSATLIGASGYLVVVVVAGLLLPTVNELGDFPADILWYFRRGSIFTNVTLWAVLGIVLVGLVGRQHRLDAEARTQRELAASL